MTGSLRARLVPLQLPVAAAMLVCLWLPGLDIVFALLSAALVLLTADDRGPIARCLQSRPLVKVGLISYSVYMVHYPVLYLAAKFHWFVFDVWARRGVADRAPLAILLAVVLALLVVRLSALTYRWVELPARRRLGRLYLRRA